MYTIRAYNFGFAFDATTVFVYKHQEPQFHLLTLLQFANLEFNAHRT